ncbi:MAG: hypothetical protein HY466_02070 [Deltaproteobacteria bacterium]|nr:hypothetical protein [Deltaproteobacteria bacterium]
MAPKVEPRVFYDVYTVGEDHVILPEGGGLSKIWDRMTGDRVVEVVDVNGDGPGDGDTAVLFNGDKVENARFQGPPLIHKLAARREFYLDLARRSLAGDGVTFDVRNIDPSSLEGFAVALAGSMQNYGAGRVEEAKDIAASVTDHPVAAGAIVAGAVALSLHPKGRMAMEAVGLAGAVGGTGYIVHDRVDGIKNDKPMGKRDLAAGFCIAGGVSALRGMTVESFWNNTVQGLRQAGRFLGEGSGLSPGWVAAGADGGYFVVSGAAAVPAVAAAVEGKTASASALLPVSQMVAAFSKSGGKVQTREVRFSEEFNPDEAAWTNSPAKTSAEDIESALELVMEELKVSGHAEEAAQVGRVLEEVRQNLEVAAEFYKRSPDPAFRQAIVEALSEIEAAANSLLGPRDPHAAKVLLEGMRQRMTLLRDSAQRLRLASFKVPGVGDKTALVLPEVPEGIELAKPLEGMLPGNLDRQRNLIRGLEGFFEDHQKGKLKAALRYVMGIYEHRVIRPNAPRVYVAYKGKKIVVLRLGDKNTNQKQDIKLARQLAKQLGLLEVFVYVMDGDQTAASGSAR